MPTGLYNVSNEAENLDLSLMATDAVWSIGIYSYDAEFVSTKTTGELAHEDQVAMKAF